MAEEIRVPEGFDVRYEIHVQEDGRWTIYTDAASKLRAIEEGQNLLASGKFDAAKVTEDRGQTKEILVWHEEAGNRGDKAVTITPVDDSPVCEKLDDFYGIEARLLMGRLFRPYLDEQGLTPIELIHDHTNIRTLKRNDDLCNQALQCIGGIWVKKTGKKSLECMDFLDKMAGQMVARAETIKDLDSYQKMFKEGGIKKVIEAAAKEKDAGVRDYIIRGALARQISRSADWEGKLMASVELAEKAKDAAALALLDEAIAEVLDSSEAAQEILGFQRNLASALQTMVQICAGTYSISEDTSAPLERLSALMGRNAMPWTQMVLMERVGRSLSGIALLTKGAREDEQDAFRELIKHMIGNKLFANSGPLCEAATLRAKSVLRDEYEDESSENAIDSMISLLPAIATKLGYLLDLCGTDFGAKSQDHIIACLANLLAGVTSVVQLVEYGASQEEIITAAAGIRDRLLKTGLPEEWRQRFGKRIYDLLISHQQNDGKTSISPAAKDDAKVKKVADPEKAPENDQEKDPANGEGPVPEGKKDAKGVSDEPLARLEYDEGDIIFREGEPGDAAYLILTGNVDILKKAGDAQVVIAHVGQGAIIGEMALIDSEPRMATVRAASKTAVTVIPSKELKIRMDRLQKFDPVLRRLVGMMVQRMRDSASTSVES